MIYMPDFRGRRFAAGGIMPTFDLMHNFFLRTGFYAMFREKRSFVPGVSGPVEDKRWHYIAEASLVYHTPIGPVSLALTKYDLRNWKNTSAPMPSNPPGFVRGFQIPARNILTPLEANPWAVSNTCSSVSALQGPAITIGRCVSTPGNANGSIFISIFVIYILIFNFQL